MGITQIHKVEEGVALPGNPFVPPKGDLCLINNLPPELLSHIFELGSEDDGTDDEDKVAAGFWDNLRHHLDAKGADEYRARDSDVGTKDQSADEDDNGDGSDETESSVDSDSAHSSDSLSPWPLFPTITSHVCRHWRNIALSTPSLWTTIPVAPQARPPYKPISTLLERSKDHPIDIYVDCAPEDYEIRDSYIKPPSDADLKFLFAMLVPHIHRWRTMEVTVSDYHHMYVFLSAVSSPSIPAALQLTSLELYHHEETEQFANFVHPSMSKHLCLFGGSAPLLTRMILWGVHVDWNQSWISSATNLRVLELAFHAEDVCPSWAQFDSILRGASALEKLSLRQSGPSGDPSMWFIQPEIGSPMDINAPIQLPKVTDFTLAFCAPARAIRLIRKLYLPALKNLVLDFDLGDYTDFVHELAGPATSLSPSQEQSSSLLSRLESLKIAGLPCPHDCTWELYGELQNLRSLNISLSYLPPFFLDTLCTPCALSGRGDTWLPRLETLYVSGACGDALREVVQCRKDAGVPLTSLYVEESSHVDSDEAEWLKQNVGTFEFYEGSEDEEDSEDDSENDITPMSSNDLLHELDDFSDED